MFNFKHSSTNQKKAHGSSNPKFSRQHTQTGAYGEKYVKQLLIDSGYKTKKRRKKRFCGDLWTLSIQNQETRNIEVKTANESQSGTYHFCLRKEGHTDTCHSDYVMLLAIDKYNTHYVYCIPSYLLSGQSLTITSHPVRYRGKFSKFRVHGHINFADVETVAAL